MPRTYFIALGDALGYSWPPASELADFFAVNSTKSLLNRKEFDGVFTISGIDGTEHEPEGKMQSAASLRILFLKPHGATVVHRFWDGKKQACPASTPHLSF